MLTIVDACMYKSLSKMNMVKRCLVVVVVVLDFFLTSLKKSKVHHSPLSF